MGASFRVILPARYASTRLPGKSLADLAGKPLIQHAWQRAMQSAANEVVIATDDQRIRAVAEGFGARVVMTATQHLSGTDRIAEATRICGFNDDDVVVNAQPDEPLLPPEVINQVANLLVAESTCGMATLCEAITEKEELFDPNLVKVVLDKHGHALYFSRAPIPWAREALSKGDTEGALPDLPADLFHRHIGIYAYRVSTVQQFSAWPAADLERVESLEQLRLLVRGIKIAVAPTCAPTPGGVDTPADLERIRAQLQNRAGC